jgi:hypothetical protein
MNVSHLALGFWVVLDAAAGTQPTINVRLYDYAGVPEDVIEKAEVEAQRVLGMAGVEIRFMSYVVRDGQIDRRRPTVIAPITSTPLLITVVPRDTLGVATGAHSLGYAIIEGQPANRAFVLYDRVRQHFLKHPRTAEFRVLGHVIAHEIAHLLLGDLRHSARGMMAAPWREKEMLQIEQGMLEFSNDEVRRLRAGAIARLQASAPDYQ